MKKISFQDEHHAGTFIFDKIGQFQKRNKIQAKYFFISTVFFNTPFGDLYSDTEVYQKIKDGALLLSGTLYFIKYKEKREKLKEIPFALMYRDDFNFTIVHILE